MRKMYLVLMACLLVSCVTNPNASPDETARSTASNRKGVQQNKLSYDGACDPTVMTGEPLEILVNRQKETLALMRDGKMMRGYPIAVVARGFPDMRGESPSSISRRHKTAKNKTHMPAIVFANNSVIRGEQYADYYKLWSKAQKTVYKRKNTGNVDVSPKQMSKVVRCASRFGAENVRVTTIQ